MGRRAGPVPGGGIEGVREHDSDERDAERVADLLGGGQHAGGHARVGRVRPGRHRVERRRDESELEQPAPAASGIFAQRLLRGTGPRRRGIRRYTIALVLTCALLKERIKDGKNPQISLIRNRGPAPWIGTYKELASC